MKVTEAEHKLTLWEDHESDTWTADSFTVKDEKMGHVHVALSGHGNQFPDFFPDTHPELEQWNVAITHEGTTRFGIVTKTSKSLGTLYLTVAVGW